MGVQNSDKNNNPFNINEEYEQRRIEREMAEKAKRDAEKNNSSSNGPEVSNRDMFQKVTGINLPKEDESKGKKREKKRRLSWLPGFRSDTTWKKVVAVVVYIGLIFYVGTIGLNQLDMGVPPFNAFFWPAISFILPAFVIGNPGYLDYKVPYYNKIPLILRRIIRVMVAFSIWFLGVWFSTGIGA